MDAGGEGDCLYTKQILSFNIELSVNCTVIRMATRLSLAALTDKPSQSAMWRDIPESLQRSRDVYFKVFKYILTD
jgi:hypothetical protein